MRSRHLRVNFGFVIFTSWQSRLVALEEDRASSASHCPLWVHYLHNFDKVGELHSERIMRAQHITVLYGFVTFTTLTKSASCTRRGSCELGIKQSTVGSLSSQSWQSRRVAFEEDHASSASHSPLWVRYLHNFDEFGELHSERIMRARHLTVHCGFVIFTTLTKSASCTRRGSCELGIKQSTVGSLPSQLWQSRRVALEEDHASSASNSPLWFRYIHNFDKVGELHSERIMWARHRTVHCGFVIFTTLTKSASCTRRGSCELGIKQCTVVSLHSQLLQSRRVALGEDHASSA